MKAKKTNNKPAPGIAQVVPKLPTLDQQQFIQALVAGKKVAKNQFSAYKVDQLREVTAQRDILMQKIQQGEQQLAALRQQMVMLEGAATQCVQDILVWDEKDVDETRKKEAATS